MSNVFTRLELFKLLQECPDKAIDTKLQFLVSKLCEKTHCQNESDIMAAKSCLLNFEKYFKRYWNTSQRTEERFLIRHAEWLKGTITLPEFGSSSSGRPQIEFKDSAERSKRRKTEEIRKQYPKEAIAFAAAMSQRAAGNNDGANLIKIVSASPRKARICKQSLSNSEKDTVKKHSPDEALAHFINAELTRKQYEVIHDANKNVYPCYTLIKDAKKMCYPNEDAFTITETMAEVKLQALLDHTTTRLCKYLHEVLLQLDCEERQSLQLVTKWGCDGSHQASYKQKFENENDSDAHIFQSCLVPIALTATANGKTKTIWQNPTPSSTRLCRPIRIRFVHESTDVINEEITYINNQIESLKKSEVPINEGVIEIQHTLLMTMVDGKVCNAATGTKSTMRCYICGQYSKDFNSLHKDFTENHDALKFGLSTLHARIRFFESILHLSYKLPIQKWQARSNEDKQLVNERKMAIQKRFKDEMGLLVDIAKPGYGNTNDGNTARRFFSNPETASEITGVNLELIKRMNTILEAITSGFHIDITKYEDYADKTAKMYVELYNWHPMSPTMHKVLVHGAAVIKQAILPIGQLSEEAAEAKNKYFRQYRTNYSRKFSRKECNRDVLNRLLLSSDPFISCKSVRPRKNRKSFSPDTLALLLPDQTDCEYDELDKIDESDEDY